MRLLSYVPRVLRLVWTASPPYTALTLLVTVLGTLSTPAQIWLSKVIIDRVAALLGTAPPAGMGVWSVLALPTTALILTLIIGDVCRSVSDNLETLLGTHVATYANYLMLQKAAALDISFYETPAFFDQLNLARNAIWRAHNLARLTVRSIGFLLSTITTLALLSTIHPLAVVVLFIVTAPHLLLRGRYAGMFFRLLNLQTPAQRMVDYLTSLLLSPDAIKEVRLFQLQWMTCDVPSVSASKISCATT